MKIDFTHQGKSVVINGLSKDHIANTIKSSGDFYEVEMLEYIAGLKPNGAIIDVGANIGNHTIFFGLFTDAKKIIAIEPYPKAFELLKQNIAANGLEDKVTAVNCAAGAGNGEVKIAPAEATNIGMTKVIKGTGTPLRPLDEIAAGENISVIKVDVEGYELEVLKGAQQILSKQHPYLFLEAATLEHKKVLDDFLLPYGYRSGREFNWTPTYVYTYQP